MKLSQDKQGLRNFIRPWVIYLILPIVVLWVAGRVQIARDQEIRKKELKVWQEESRQSQIYQDSVDKAKFKKVAKPKEMYISPADSAELRLEKMLRTR